MCLAIPAKITSLDASTLTGSVEILGVSRQASMKLTPTVQVGDYVLIHAGFAIEIVDEASAQETLDLIAQFPELAGEEFSWQQAQTATDATNTLSTNTTPFA